MKILSLLRGINVSGQKRIPMNELRELYGSIGLQHPASYIQSGNVWFEAAAADAALASRIEAAIAQRFACDVPVLLRTQAQLEEVIAGFPFDDLNPLAEGTRVLVTFFAMALSPASVPETAETILQPFVKAPERLVICGTAAYLYCPYGYGRTKLNNAFLERKLGVTATTRNWKTLLALKEMVGNG